MLFLLSFIFIASLAAGNCSFTVGGKKFDLSALDGKVARGPDSEISTYQYLASVCSNMVDVCKSIMTGETLHGNAYILGYDPEAKPQQVCWDVLSKYDGFKATALDKSAPNGTTGFTLNFANGDVIDDNDPPIKTVMNMICDWDNEVGKLSGFHDSEVSNRYIINYPTKYACPLWGINGTFNGNMTCISPDCDITPDSIIVKGSCTNMMAVVREGNDMTIWGFDFDTCGGYMARGTLSIKTTNKILNDDDESFLFEMNMHHDGTVWILVNQPKFPYDLMAWVELKLL